MMSVNIHEAKTNLSKLLNQVELHKQKIRICRNGQPIAELSPISIVRRSPLEPCPALQGSKICYDPTQPLTEDEWPSDFL